MSRTSSNDKIYNSWRKMHVRCYDLSYHAFHRYGGRGIEVCPRWQVYGNFKQDMENTWFDGATVDRINPDGNYEPGNCQWLPKGQNVRPPIVNLQQLLDEYNAGASQQTLANKYRTYQPHVSRMLARARKARQNGASL
jgi:hypothetical protein